MATRDAIFLSGPRPGAPRFVAPGGIGPTARHWRIAASCPSPSPTPPRLSPMSDRRSSGRRGPRPRVKARLPVQRRAAGRSPPGRARLRPQQQLHLEPHAGGDLRHPGDRQVRIQRPEERIHERDVYGADACCGEHAVVSPMANPLVALYSAPPSPGASMYVQFAQQGPTLSWQNTSPLPIVPGESTNFIVAGMLPNTTYLMRHVLDDGTVSAPLAFTTGSLPANLHFPTFTVVQPPAAGTDLSQSEIFHAGVNKGLRPHAVNTLATDLNGNVIWYYDPVANGFPGYAQNLEPGGTVMMLGGNAVGVAGGYNTLRQVDLAGDTLRETNIHAVNAKLAAMHQPQILDFDHEAKLLPNGDTVVLASTPKTVNYKGRPTKFIGDMVIVLDQNFQPVWVWNSFRWLNTNRLGTDHPVPTDWLHANSVSWSPEDADLVVSLRTQDWAIKINYANGTGNGRVVWKLGAGGNFKAIANTPNPWFSHQHDVRYINDNTLLVFDDGNTRQATDPRAHSRGQEWILNEQNMTATLVVNADMGNYSDFLGSSELLSNGNLAFTSGGLVAEQQSGRAVDRGAPKWHQDLCAQMSEFEYRSYFESTLYSADLLD